MERIHFSNSDVHAEICVSSKDQQHQTMRTFFSATASFSTPISRDEKTPVIPFANSCAVSNGSVLTAVFKSQLCYDGLFSMPFPHRYKLRSTLYSIHSSVSYTASARALHCRPLAAVRCSRVSITASPRSTSASVYHVNAWFITRYMLFNGTSGSSDALYRIRSRYRTVESWTSAAAGFSGRCPW